MTRARMTADEAETVRQLVRLSGLTVRQIMRAITRSPRHEVLFAVAVELATGAWDWLDGETGHWRTDRAKQHEKLLRYANLLIEDEPCAAPSPSN